MKFIAGEAGYAEKTGKGNGTKFAEKNYGGFGFWRGIK